MVFHDSTPKFIFSKYQNKAEIQNMDDSEVLISDFSGLRTSAASMTSLASATSMASTTSEALFHQITSWSWWLDHPWHQNDQSWSIFVEWIIKNPILYWFLHLFCQRLLRPANVNLFKLVKETQMSTSPEATRFVVISKKVIKFWNKNWKKLN